MRQHDLEAGMTNTQLLMDSTIADIQAMVIENGLNEEQGEQVFYPPESISADAEDEIPRGDPTYRFIGTTLIPHQRLPDVHLFQYITFCGHKAYQPCSANMDIMNLFQSLAPVEKEADKIFQKAREWSCIVQALPDIPQDVRWILATIFNFATDMLQPGTEENTL